MVSAPLGKKRRVLRDAVSASAALAARLQAHSAQTLQDDVPRTHQQGT